MLKWIAAYVGAGVAFAAIDFVWLTQMTDRLYKPVIGPIMGTKPDMVAAVAFYLIMIGGIVFLAIAPALKEGAWTRAALNGAVLGFVAYATYDLNQSGDAGGVVGQADAAGPDVGHGSVHGGGLCRVFRGQSGRGPIGLTISDNRLSTVEFRRAMLSLLARTEGPGEGTMRVSLVLGAATAMVLAGCAMDPYAYGADYSGQSRYNKPLGRESTRARGRPTARSIWIPGSIRIPTASR